MNSSIILFSSIKLSYSRSHSFNKVLVGGGVFKGELIPQDLCVGNSDWCVKFTDVFGCYTYNISSWLAYYLLMAYLYSGISTITTLYKIKYKYYLRFIVVRLVRWILI